jgi:hypothetical protein
MSEAQSGQGSKVLTDHQQHPNVNPIDSVVLARLVAEVRNEEPATAHRYDRQHNRHNR